MKAISELLFWRWYSYSIRTGLHIGTRTKRRPPLGLKHLGHSYTFRLFSLIYFRVSHVR